MIWGTYRMGDIMYYKFNGEIFKEGTRTFIKIPFNVWDVCDKRGNLPANVTINEYTYECKLLPKGNGNYYIPVTKDNLKNINSQDNLDISFEFIDSLTRINSNSPYSIENPIRKINNIDLIAQPEDDLCIQACAAMLAGVTLNEVIDLMKSKKYQASMSKLIETLDYYGIAHADKMIYRPKNSSVLPKCCIINTQSHFMIYFDGKYYDPSRGILHEYDSDKITGYLEIFI